MNGTSAVEIRNIGKRYTLGRKQAQRTLRESLSDLVRRRDDGESTTLWALRNIDLSIGRGEAVGIIGRNGAGKSTLLKILSRITDPTEGEVQLRGRVGSLLEVGTGFHPELTGRENIFLNGAILGMKRAEVKRNFDSIVAFAEVESFLDTAVKHYSSGMYVRLAFAVAAHLEPEILIIDEVLAVGDAAFQKKCLGKMSEVAQSGRTVLFVSHNMGAMKSLTSRVAWIDAGKLREVGPSATVVDHYLRGADSGGGAGEFDDAYLETNRSRHQKYVGRMRLKKVTVRDGEGRPTPVILEGARVQIEIEFDAASAFDQLEVILRLRTLEGQLVSTLLPGQVSVAISTGRNRVVIGFSTDRLVPGRFTGDVVLMTQLPQDSVAPAFEFEIAEDPKVGQTYRGTLFGAGTSAATSDVYGLVRVPTAVIEGPVRV